MMILSDVGGTHMRFAFYDGQTLSDIRTYRPTMDTSFQSVLTQFLSEHPTDSADTLIVGAAGLTDTTGSLTLTNRPDTLNPTDLKKHFGFLTVHLVNDFVCQALGALAVPASALVYPWGGDVTTASGPKVVIGPGTGLGVCFLVAGPDGTYYPAASEGGHQTLPHLCFKEPAWADIYHRLGTLTHPLSVEDVVSGRGICHLYRALKPNTSDTLTPEDVFERAQTGDETAMQAYHLFFDFLGAFAGDMVLTMKASGGVYLTGGILRQPAVLQWFCQSDFKRYFQDKGRLSPFLTSVPTAVISEHQVAFLGLQKVAQIRGAEKK